MRWFRLHMKVHFYRDRVIHSHEGYVLRHPEVTPIEFEVREDLPATSAIAIQGYLKHDRFGDAEQRQISLQLEFVGIARGSNAGGSERDCRIVIHRKEPWSLDHLVLDKSRGLRGTPGVATYSLPFQDPKTPFTSPAEEPTKNSTLLLGTSITNSRPGCAGVSANRGAPQQSSNIVIIRIFIIESLLFIEVLS